MDADHERRIATLRVVLASSDLVINWSLDSADRDLFAEWTAKRARYRMLLSHILGTENT